MSLGFADRLNVLVIDNPKQGRGYLQSPLQQIGFKQIKFVHNEMQADAAIELDLPNIIMCAYSIATECDGYYYMQKLISTNKLPQTCCLILITADDTPELQQSIAHHQAHAHLAVPFTNKQLQTCLEQTLLCKQLLLQVDTVNAQGKHHAALTLIESILNKVANSPLYEHILHAKAQHYVRTNDQANAIRIYRELLAQYPRARYSIQLAYLIIENSNLADAERFVIQQTSDHSQDAEHYSLLSLLQWRQNDQQAALESAELAAKINKHCLRSHENLRLLAKYAYLPDIELKTAERLLRLVQGTVYDSPKYYLDVLRASVELARSNEEQLSSLLVTAKRTIQQLKRHFPNMHYLPELNLMQARIHHLQNNNERAMALIASSDMQEHRLSFEGLMDKAKALLELGASDEAIELCNNLQRRAAKLIPQTASYSFQNDILHAHCQALLTSLKVHKCCPRALHVKGQKALQLGRVEHALQLFTDSLYMMPRNTQLALHILKTLCQWQGIAWNSKLLSILAQCTELLENSKVPSKYQQEYRKLKPKLPSSVDYSDRPSNST